MHSGKGTQVRNAKIKLHKVVDIMGWKAIGNKLADYSKNDKMDWVAPTPPNPQQELFSSDED